MREIALQAAEKGGAILKKYWGKLPSVEYKLHPSDLVTIADKEAEAAVINHLLTHFPDHAILAEESGTAGAKDASFTWIIDPLDGTTNYTHQYPMVAIAIALQQEGEIVLGIVYNPIYEELFIAERGKGAFFNGEKMRVSTTADLQNGLLATGFAYDRQLVPETNYSQFCHLTHISQGVRRGGSAALDLAYVAAGRLDGFWERGLKPWDLAAGKLLVEEAGGRVTGYEMAPFDLFSGKIVASNGVLHEILSHEILHS